MCKLLLSFIFLFSFCFPGSKSIVFPLYERQADEIKVHDLMFKDESRDREIPAKIYTPINTAGEIPLVLFSHGGGQTRHGYSYYGEHLAANGYLVVVPQHYGTDWSIFEKGKLFRNLKKAFQFFRNPTNHVKRVEDMQYLIDQKKEIEAIAKVKIDMGKIGMSGHSMGAFTTQAMAGVQSGIENFSSKKSLRDERIQAFIAFSPQGTERYGIVDGDAWAEFDRPFLFATGTMDVDFKTMSYVKRVEGFSYAPPGDKYLMVIRGANHNVFEGPDKGADEDELEVIRSVVLAFWDHYLLKDEKAKEYLLSLKNIKTRIMKRFEYK